MIDIKKAVEAAGEPILDEDELAAADDRQLALWHRQAERLRAHHLARVSSAGDVIDQLELSLCKPLEVNGSDGVLFKLGSERVVYWAAEEGDLLRLHRVVLAPGK